MGEGRILVVNKLLPDSYVKSVFDIDYEKLLKQGYKGIIFDIDSTLVPHGAESTKEIDELFGYLHSIGLKTLFLSNNSSERIEIFNKNINTQFIAEANKPNKQSYLRAIEMLGIKSSEVVLIGDQIFTDILGANLCGIKNILVKYLMYDDETKIGKKRRVESVILVAYYFRKLISRKHFEVEKQGTSKVKRKSVSEIIPFLYPLAEKKEIFRRHIKNIKQRKSFSTQISKNKLPNLIYSHSSNLIKKGKDIDPVLQENKAFNIDLSASNINGVIIHPGEEFSFWKLVGKINKKNGYKDGRVIINNKVQAGMGGGLCNLGNTINILIMHSPLIITEVHYHSDALAPDQGHRVPLANGTSVAYNYVDYRFKNPTRQSYQICVWCENNQLMAELRSEKAISTQYKITEEDHHFMKKNSKYYRKSKIYKVTEDKETNREINKELVWDNKSEVMFDYNLIPVELIR
ncbi:YqeG family HAD IIIA-type phosphatase [Staphylococcus gallinarum]|nr:YqeG family HAD IIIA-type phosphatase [Staphylococcus gallinarum]RIO80336.1 YqeG family HAD IIIA-type phosphatase [Staphylococcus gallinarum]